MHGVETRSFYVSWALWDLSDLLPVSSLFPCYRLMTGNIPLTSGSHIHVQLCMGAAHGLAVEAMAPTGRLSSFPFPPLSSWAIFLPSSNTQDVPQDPKPAFLTSSSLFMCLQSLFLLV